LQVLQQGANARLLPVLLRLFTVSFIQKYLSVPWQSLAPARSDREILLQSFGKKVDQVAPTRSNLINKGMIYSRLHGDTEFTVPLFDEFLRREIPVFSLKD
jgi:hypothetical protein